MLRPLVTVSLSTFVVLVLENQEVTQGGREQRSIDMFDVCAFLTNIHTETTDNTVSKKPATWIY